MATILTVNPGSSSVRLLYVHDGADGDHLHLEQPATDADAWRQIRAFVADHDAPDAIAHRLVHGGDAVRHPTIVTDDILADIADVTSLAPLHIPATLRLVDALRTALPAVTQVLCPDTAFHAGLPDAAATYALPWRWREKYGLRRYGFHGLSYAWALARAAALLHRPADDLHLIAAHLGGGASVCAIRDGHSVDTSMGFTPLDGIAMSRRSGAVDPGLLLWLLDGRLTPDDLDKGLNHDAGLYGLSHDRTDDTRILVPAARDGDPAAQLALDVYTHRIRREFAAAATSLHRIDAVVFTGEIGWDQPEIRDAVCTDLWPLGVNGPLDTADSPDDRIVSTSGTTPVLVIQAQENRQLAIDAERLLHHT